ncbi:MAG: NAD(P)-binding protein [Actinomycetota bacterium]
MKSGRHAGRIAIIGGGPCGLACGRELARLGYDDWTIFERNGEAGGHASSLVDPAGFTWDLGGHVVFSHFGEFDLLLEEVMGDDLVEHERASYVSFAGRWVPFPFQNNLRYLPADAAYECLLGLIEAPGADGAVDFATWIERTFGSGITRHFMRPYNSKVWAVPLERMSATWIADRVSVLDFRRALRNVVFGQDDVGWGHNNRFKFPTAGGTGEIYRRLAKRLGGHVEYGHELASVDLARRRLSFANSREEEFDTLVSTMPLDRFVSSIAGPPSEVRRAAAELEHTGVWMVGVGYERALADDRCWMYFPQADVPFYRVTNFAKYAAANVPRADTGRYSSYLTETSYSPYRPVSAGSLTERVPQALREVALVDGAEAVSVHAVDIEYAYPIPSLTRDAALAVVQPWLMERGIYSRGRFGSWRYEIGNMDHAVKMGLDVARLILEGRPEELWTQ